MSTKVMWTTMRCLMMSVVASFGGCTPSSHSEACSSRSYAECACPEGYLGTMACVDGVYGECRCPRSCGVTGAMAACSCDVPGLPTEGTQTCLEEGVWDVCTCETDAVACTAGRRSRCECATGGVGETVCATDGVWEACVCGPLADSGTPDGCSPITCEAVGVQCGSVADGCGRRLDCGPCEVDLTSLALPANEMVWDPTRLLLLVGAAIRVGDPGSVIRAIDPTTLATAFEVPVNGDPEHLALADDGRSLWVTIDGDFRQYLLHVDLESQTVAEEIPLPYTMSGSPLMARDLIVLPGSSTVVVAVSDDFDSFADERLLVYEDAVMRAELAGLRDSPAESLMAVDAATVVGFGFGYLTAYRWTGSEITATRTTADSLSEGQVTYESERIFSERGWVVDANTFNELDSVGVMGTCVAEEGGTRAYYLEWNDDLTIDLVVADPPDRVRVSSQPLGTPAELRTSSLVRWGDRGLAFLGTTATSREAVPDTVFVVTTDAVGVSRP